MSSKGWATKMSVEILYALAGKESPYINRYTRTQVTRKLRDMNRDRYVAAKGEGYLLTRRGEYLLRRNIIYSLKIVPPKNWDGKWRMVLFDIPVTKGKLRNIFRSHLKELGLVLYQHSVWVYPYPLEEAVRKISDFYKLSDYVLFAVAEKLNGENKLKKKFNL